MKKTRQRKPSDISCPECGTDKSGVVDTSGRPDKKHIRRRRECSNGHRFTTEERIVGSFQLNVDIDESTVECFSINQKVKIKPFDISGVVVGYFTSESPIEYKVRFFADCELRFVFFTSAELERET